MFKVLTRELDFASRQWMTTQRHSVIRSWQERGDGEFRLPAHSSALMAASTGLLENDCLREIEALHSPSLYGSVQAVDKSVATNHLLFRLLSREAGSVHQRLTVRHRHFFLSDSSACSTTQSTPPTSQPRATLARTRTRRDS